VDDDHQKSYAVDVRQTMNGAHEILNHGVMLKDGAHQNVHCPRYVAVNLNGNHPNDFSGYDLANQMNYG
jgi:hypothetical protein